jgi:hypothetical protein
MKVLGVLIQNDNGEAELLGVKDQPPQTTFSFTGTDNIVTIPTPEAIKEEQGIEESKKKGGIDAILEKHNK